MKIIKVNTEEVIKEATALVEDVATTANIKVDSMPTLEKATTMLGQLRLIKKEVADKKGSVVKPLNEALKNLRALFKPVEEHIDTLETGLKDEVLKYNTKLLEEQKKREEQALQDIKDGKTIDEASKSVERVTEKIEKIKTRKVAVLKIVNYDLIPRQYLVPDERSILNNLKNGEKIDGCELVYEEIAVNTY